MVLTPHLTAPIDDRAAPNEREILLSGIYNLGFLGLAFNERTLPFLDWWPRRLYRECLHEVERGLFVDQRWMDFAPAFLPSARDPARSRLQRRLLEPAPTGGSREAATGLAASTACRCASSTSAATTSSGRS